MNWWSESSRVTRSKSNFPKPHLPERREHEMRIITTEPPSECHRLRAVCISAVEIIINDYLHDWGISCV